MSLPHHQRGACPGGGHRLLRCARGPPLAGDAVPRRLPICQAPPSAAAATAGGLPAAFPWERLTRPTAVEEVVARRCGLSGVPSALLQLPRLRVLRLADNDIEALPVE